MNLTEGTVVAEHYELLKHIGQGSFGDVWLAHNLLADVDVAIKFYGSLDQQGLEDLRNEFKIAYRLNHPNLLNINHFDVTDNCPFLVMPYCANGSVRRYSGKMQESDIWVFIKEVASGLAFLHGQYPPIVHQDIKPDNILITAEGHYVISDFGISRSLQTRMSRTMNNFSSSGTIAYMGPERFSEEPKIILASDIWALGMTIYEVAMGDVLWEGMGGCVQLNGARIPTLDNSRFSYDLNNLIRACLSVDTRMRPTAAQVAEFASCWLERKPLPVLHGLQQQVPPVYHQQHEPVIQEHPTTKAYESAQTYYTSPSDVGYYTKPAISSKNEKTSLFASLNTDRLAIGVLIALAIIAIGAGIYIFIDLNSDVSATKTAPAKAEKAIESVQPQQTELREPSSPNYDGRTQSVPQGKKPLSVKSVTTTKKERIPTYIKTTTQGHNGVNSDDDRLFSKCKTAADFNLYLSRFPNGRHASEARKKLQAFQQRYEQINNALPSGSRRSHKTLINR